MRVAVTAKEASINGPVDPRFGRARYFVVVDLDTDRTEIHPNDVNLNAAQGAGIQTASNIARLQVGAVLTSHVGPNAFRVLSASGIAVYSGASGTVAEAIEDFKKGALSEAKSADVEGHWV